MVQALESTMDGQLDPFVYLPLAHQDSIRLFIFTPSDHDAPLIGSLIYTTLETLRTDLVDSYAALSYVWGDS